jgi:hypothetical protein
MSREELEAKFKTFASRVIPSQRAEKAIELIRNLDALHLVRELSSLLGKTEDLPGAGSYSISNSLAH